MAWGNLPTSGSGGGKSKGLKSFGPKPVDLSPPKLTLSQALALREAKKKGHSGSFWDSVKHAGSHALHPVEWTFDKILRPVYGLSEAVANEHRAQNKGKGFLGQLEAGAHGFVQGVEGKKKHGFGAALPFTHDTPEHHTFLRGHGTIRGALGFTADVVFDPTTYISGGSTIFAKSAEHAAAIAAGRRAIEDAGLNVVQAGKVSAHEAIQKVEKDVAALKSAGPNYKFRHALANAHLQQLKGVRDGTEFAKTPIRRMEAGALAEEKRVEQFVPHYKIGGVRVTPTHLGSTEKIGGKLIGTGVRIAPALPKLDHVVERGGLAGLTARKFREMFVRDASQTPEVKAMEMVQKHHTEELMNDYMRTVSEFMPKMDKSFTADRARQVLHYFEQPGKGVKAVVKNADGLHILNEKYIGKLINEGKITHAEADFVRGMHKSYEYLFHADRAYGVHVTHFSDSAKGAGKMYVPHMMAKGTDVQSDAMKKLTTVAGFQRKRGARHMSLQQIADGYKKAGGNLDEVVHDPYQLLVARARASATQAASQATLDAAAHIGAVSTRAVDQGVLDATRNRMGEIQKRLPQLERAQTRTMADAHAAEQRALATHEANYWRDIKRARSQKAINARTEQHMQEAVDIAKNQHLPVGEAMQPHLIKAGKIQAEHDALTKELKTLAKKEKDTLKGTAAKYDKSIFTHTSSGLKDAHGNPMALTSDLGQAVEKVRKVYDGDEKILEDFDTFYRKALSKWKLGVTSINPGYRIRNSLTDLWNWWLVPGMHPVAAAKYMGKATQLMRTLKNADRKLREFGAGTRDLSTGEQEQLRAALAQYHDMYQHGVLSGLFLGDVNTITDMLKTGWHSKKEYASRGRMIKLYAKMAQDVNRSGENFVRVAHYLWQRDRGLSPVEAAMSVKAAHFDYEDLTRFEQKRMKSIAPFYTWTRKNIPYQIKAMAKAPGKYSAFPKAAMESEQAAGGDPGNILPGYIAQNFGFQIPVGKHNYILPQLGVSDLQALNSPAGLADRATGLVSPAIRAPFELMANKNLFTGAQISPDTHSRVPGGYIGALLSRLPGGLGGTTTRLGPGGKHVSVPGINPYLAYAIQQGGPLASLGLKLGDSRQLGKTNPLVSYLGGTSVTHVDPALQQAYANIGIQNTVKKDIQDLRDEGIIPQAKRSTSRKNKYMNQQLLQLLGRR